MSSHWSSLEPGSLDPRNPGIDTIDPGAGQGRRLSCRDRSIEHKFRGSFSIRNIVRFVESKNEVHLAHGETTSFDPTRQIHGSSTWQGTGSGRSAGAERASRPVSRHFEFRNLRTEETDQSPPNHLYGSSAAPIRARTALLQGEPGDAATPQRPEVVRQDDQSRIEERGSRVVVASGKDGFRGKTAPRERRALGEDAPWKGRDESTAGARSRVVSRLRDGARTPAPRTVKSCPLGVKRAEVVSPIQVSDSGTRAR